MSIFKFGAAGNPPRRPTEQSPFCTSPSQLREVTLDSNMDTTIPFPGRSPGKTSPLRGHALKEYEEQLTHLKKENFNLKLRIYFLEERMGRMNADDKEDVIKKNIELRVETESLRKDVSDKQELLCHASKAVELLEEQHRSKLKQIQSEHDAEKGMLESHIQELEKEIKESEAKYLASTIHHTQEIDQLQHKIEELESQVNQLSSNVHDESERANQLHVNLQEAIHRTERLNHQCQKLEDDLKQRDSHLEKLLQECRQKDQDLSKNSDRIKSLEDALSAKEQQIQIKDEELHERDGLIDEKQRQIEEQCKIHQEIQINLDEKQHEIDALHSSLTTKDETITILQSKFEKAEAFSSNMETKLKESLQEVSRLKGEIGDLKIHGRHYKKTREGHRYVHKVDENVSSLHGSSVEEDMKKRLTNELFDKDKKLQVLEEREKSSALMLTKIRQELNQKVQEIQVLKTQAKGQALRLSELEKKLKEKDEKMNEVLVRQKKSLETIQTFAKMIRDSNHEMEQKRLDLKKKDQQIKDLISQCNELRDGSKKSSLYKRQRVRTETQGADDISSTCNEAKGMTEEENESLLKQFAEKEKCLGECKVQLDSLTKELNEKERSLYECEKQLEMFVNDVQVRDKQLTMLEHELNEVKTSLRRPEGILWREMSQQTDEIDLTVELAAKKLEIERLNSELRKRTTNLQELVNKELWDKNREIKKLQDRINLMCERKECEVAALQEQIEAKDTQLEIVHGQINQLTAQVACSSTIVGKEMQPLTKPLNFQQSQITSVEIEAASLRQQLDSNMEEKKKLCERSEEMKEQFHNAFTEKKDNSFSKECLQCKKAKEEAERAIIMHRETAEICTMLTQRLEELVQFLSSLLRNPEFLRALGQKKHSILKQVVENSMELSRVVTVSISEAHETSLQMNSLAALLTSTSELSLSLFRLQENEDDSETGISCDKSSISAKELSQNKNIEEEMCKLSLFIQKPETESSQILEQNHITDNPSSGVSFIKSAADNHNENKAESGSSLNSMTFYNSRHNSNANEKWPRPLPLSLRKEDNIEAKDHKFNSGLLHKAARLRISHSANVTPVKTDSTKISGILRIRRSSSANAVSGSTLNSVNQHREYGIASLSESEAWSEPDRSVSMARIGLREDSLFAGNMYVTGGSGRDRRFKDVEVSSESSEETARETTRTPGKRIRGDTGDMRKLQNRVRVLEQLNEALRAELNILHHLTPQKVGHKVEDCQPLMKDISVNTSELKLDKSTSIEQLQNDESSVTVPVKLLEQIRSQREKLESSLFHNDFIRRHLEHIFVTLTNSQGSEIGDIWQKLKETTEELCAARAKVQEFHGKIIQLELQLEDSKSKVQLLEITTEQLQTTCQTVPLLKEQIACLETKVKEKDNEILEQNCLLLETRNRNEELLIQAAEETNRLKEELERLPEMLLVDSKQQLREYEMKLKDVEKQKEIICSEMSEKIKKIELEIYEAERRRNEAEIQVIAFKQLIQDEETKRSEAEWRIRKLEDALKVIEAEHEKYFNEMFERMVKEIELNAKVQLSEVEKRFEQRELILKAEAEKKIQEAEHLGSEFEASLKYQIEEAEKHGAAIRAEGERKIKDLEEKFKVREEELKKRIHDSEHAMWEKESQLRQQLDEASMKHSQISLERTQLVNEKLHLEQELHRYEVCETELLREKREANNLSLLSKDKFHMKVLKLEERKNDLERTVRDLEDINSELKQRLAKIHPADNYLSHHMSGSYSSSFPYRKVDAISSSSGLDTYSGDGGSLPSSIWSLPPGSAEESKRKEDNFKGDNNCFGLSAFPTPILHQSFSRQLSEMSDYMSEEAPVEEFTQICSNSWFSLDAQQSAHTGNSALNSAVSRNTNSSPDLGIESDQGRFSSLETSTLPPTSVLLDTTDLVRNPTYDLDFSVSAAKLVPNCELEDENARLLKENVNLKRDLMHTRRYLQATLSQLTSSNQLKKQLEKAICRQLYKTHHILKQARRNGPENKDMNYLTTTVESTE